MSFEEAVEAAAQAEHAEYRIGSADVEWGELSETWRETHRIEVAPYLRAALPHLLADVRALAEKFAAEAPHDKQISDMQPSDFIAVGRAVVGERIRDELDRLTEEAGR